MKVLCSFLYSLALSLLFLQSCSPSREPFSREDRSTQELIKQINDINSSFFAETKSGLSIFQKIGVAIADATGAVTGGLIAIANPGTGPLIPALAAGASWFAKSAFTQYNENHDGIIPDSGSHSGGSGQNPFRPEDNIYPEVEDTSSLGLMHNEILMEMMEYYEVIQDYSLSQEDQLALLSSIASELNIAESTIVYNFLDSNIELLEACAFDGMGEMTVPEYYSHLINELPEYAEALSVFEPIAIGLNSVPTYDHQAYASAVCSVIMESSVSVNLKKILIDGIDVGVASSIFWDELEGGE